MSLDAIGVLVLLSFGIINSCGLIYIAKSIISFTWKMIDIHELIKEAEKEN